MGEPRRNKPVTDAKLAQALKRNMARRKAASQPDEPDDRGVPTEAAHSA